MHTFIITVRGIDGPIAVAIATAPDWIAYDVRDNIKNFTPLHILKIDYRGNDVSIDNMKFFGK